MLTELIAPVDRPNEKAVRSVLQVAKRAGLSKQAGSNKLKRLAAAGVFVEHDASGRPSQASTSCDTT